jgi:PAS domain S-box-containing protein
MQINKKTSFLLGFKEDEMLGKDWISLLIEEKKRENLKSQYQQFVEDKNKTFIRFTATVNAKDGTEKMIDWQCAPLQDENSHVYGSVISGQDISDQIRLREELSHLKRKYEPHIKKLTTELSLNKQKYHSEAIKGANARSRFKFWFELENTLINLSKKQLSDQKEIKNRIQKALKIFGEISNVEHGYVYKFTQSGSHMINTHLWVAGEPLLEPDIGEETSLDKFIWFKKNIQKKEIIHIPKIEEMPKEAASEKEVYLSQGIKSFINVPIVHNNSAIGYIGFETSEKEKKWDNDEINIIKVISRLISSITNPSQSSEPQAEKDLPKMSSVKTLENSEDPKIPSQETESSIDNELKKARESFEKEFQEKIKSMEQAQTKLTSELKERKEIEANIRASRDSIERDLEEMRSSLQKKEAELATMRTQLQSKEDNLSIKEIEEFKTKISQKDNEIKSLRKSIDEEKSAKTQLEKNLNKAQDSITQHKKDIEVLETANQVMGAELEELKNSKEEFLEDVQREMENLGIANELLRSTIKDKNYLIEEANENSSHYEQMDLSVFSLDQDGNILSWSDTAESLTGYAPELALARNISFLFAEKDSFNFEQEFLIPLKDNSKHSLEIAIKKSDGEVFSSLISMTAIKDRKGILTIMGYFTHLSDVKNEDEIKSIKKQFTDLLGSSGVFLVSLSPDYLISEMNEKAISTFQWDRENTLGKDFFEMVLPPENWQEISADIQGRMNTQESADLETYIAPNDQTRYSYLWSLAKEIDPENETPQGYLAIGRDITDFRNAKNKLIEKEFLLNSVVDKAIMLEDKLKNDQEKYENTINKMAFRKEGLRTVEHITSSVVDLVNNPIQGVENILEQIKQQAEMADIHKGLVSVAINECRRVTDLIGKLKSFQPPTKENLESFDVHEILDEVTHKSMDTINDRTITVEKDYTHDLPPINGVTPQIRHAIDNILKNAEESLSEDDGKITISTERDGPNVKIHIKDTGCGILEANIDRIFDPFFTTKSAIHRPGLGLLASLGIVKNHKGTIDVHSKPGEGTTFTVTLPLKQPLNPNGGS